MNFTKKNILKKRIISELAHSSNNFSVNSHNSLQHETLKLKEFWVRKRLGHDVITEAKFKDGKGIADIIDMTEGKIIEILHSEKIEEAKKKVKKYPEFLEVEFLSTSS